MTASAGEPSPVLKKLRASREPLRQLVRAFIDDLLSRPLDAIIDVQVLTADVAAAVRATAADPDTGVWLHARLSTMLEICGQERSDGPPIKRHLPPTGLQPIRSLVAQPFTLNEELAGELLDHEALYNLVRELLTKALIGYTREITELFPGGKLVTGLFGRARGLAAASIGDSASALEHRANAFVDEALAPSIGRVAAYLADDASAESLADWRGHMLDRLLEQRSGELLALLSQADPDAIVAELTALLDALASWPELDVTIASALHTVLARVSDQNLREQLTGSGLDPWRDVIENQVLELLWPFVNGEVFERWLADQFGQPAPA